MQKWEYFIVSRSREFPFTGSAFTDKPTQWVTWKQGEDHPSSQSLIQILDELGKNGWELVTVLCESSRSGKAIMQIPSSGLTTEETWIFKHPLE